MSIIEAELLTLKHVLKETIAIKRFFNKIRLDIE